jgi:hypothetical protein
MLEMKKAKDPNDFAPMFLVDGPLTKLAELPYGVDPAPHRYRSRNRAERQAARLNQRIPGHRVIEGVGGRSGWRAL